MTMRVAMTGAEGFLGWHLRCRLLAQGVDDVVALSRASLAHTEDAAQALKASDVVVHLAGVNRGSDSEIEQGNRAAAEQLTAACDQAGVVPHLVYANSIHSTASTTYGLAKREAADLLRCWAEERDGTLADVLLPNLFGEHGRPHYNSVVATFCHLLASGGRPEVTSDAEIPLMHAQAAAQTLIDAACAGQTAELRPDGTPVLVSAILKQLSRFARLYAGGEIPDLSTPFDRDMFNTYRSFTVPASLPIAVRVRGDERGDLFECVRSHGGTGQTFMSSSKAGITRGEHFHLHKVERFLVVRGKAQIRLRRLFDDTIFRYDVSGEHPAIIDMPTMWAHSITNTGDDELLTLFWANDLLDSQSPDTYPHTVCVDQEPSR